MEFIGLRLQEGASRYLVSFSYVCGGQVGEVNLSFKAFPTKDFGFACDGGALV